MKNTEKKAKTLTGYLNNSWKEKKRKEKSVTERKKRKRTPVSLKFLKNIRIKNFSLTDVEFLEQNLPFEAKMLSNYHIFFVVFFSSFYGKNEKI